MAANVICLQQTGLPTPDCEVWSVPTAEGVALACPTCGNKLVALAENQDAPKATKGKKAPNIEEPVVVVPTVIAPVGTPPPVIEGVGENAEVDPTEDSQSETSTEVLPSSDPTEDTQDDYSVAPTAAEESKEIPEVAPESDEDDAGTP